jgi:hypothetical protein
MKLSVVVNLMMTIEESLLFVFRIVLEMTWFVFETEFAIAIVVTCSKMLTKSELVFVLVFVVAEIGMVMMHEMAVSDVETLVLLEEVF